jgi:hypothetical protein
LLAAGQLTDPALCAEAEAREVGPSVLPVKRRTSCASEAEVVADREAAVETWRLSHGADRTDGTGRIVLRVNPSDQDPSLGWVLEA